MTIWALILVATLIAAPILIERLRPKMTEHAQKDAQGDIATLSQGKTHFRWDGPDDGPICVCVHGLTTPSFVWRGLIPFLTKMGFRTLSYDLYGRGYSDTVHGAQDGSFFIQQLADLLAHEKIDQPATFIGYSMGGAIVSTFAAKYPERITRLILIAPAGMKIAGHALVRFCINLPVLGVWLFHILYPVILRRGFKAEEALPTSVLNITDLQRKELNRRGFLPAVYSSLSHFLKKPLSTEHHALAEANIPILAIWAAEDAVIPIAAKDVLTSWNAQVSHEIVSNAGHGITYTHTEAVAHAIERFIPATC